MMTVLRLELFAFSLRLTKILFELGVEALDIEEFTTSLLKLLGERAVLDFEVVVGLRDDCLTEETERGLSE